MIPMTGPRCGMCRGHAWVPVTEAYVQARLLQDADPATVQTRLAKLRNSAMPCAECQPEQHRLWQGGHLEPGHRCEICRPARTRNRR